MIDENNGIVPDQYWIADRFCEAITVQNFTIVNSYYLITGKLEVEFYTISGKPIVTIGKDDKDFPFVDSYKICGYQKTVLERMP